MGNETNDEKTEQDSSTAQVDKGAASTTAGTPSETPKGEAKDLRAALEEKFGTPASQTEDKEEKGEEEEEEESTDDSQKGEDKEEKKEDSKTEGEEKKEGEEDQEKGPIPYDRFQTVVQEKNDAVNWRQQHEGQVKAYQSIDSFCRSHGISVEEYGYWMDVAALSKTNPIAAMEKLKPQLQNLQSATGDVLPKDLQDAVENGDITAEWAKEVAKARTQAAMGQRQTQESRQQQAQTRQQQFMTELETGLNNWSQAKSKLDPELKFEAGKPPSGKLGFVLDRVGSMWRSGAEVNSVADLIALAEKALEAVNKDLKPFVPARNGSTVVRSSQSSTRTTPKAEPKTMAEAIRMGAAAAAKH